MVEASGLPSGFSGAGPTAAAWLEVTADDGAVRRLPLTRAACVALARMVLAGVRGGEVVATPAEIFAACGGDDPGLAAWLAECGAKADPVGEPRCGTAVARLAAGLVVAAQPAVVPEAALLREALQAALAAEHDERRFAAEVATARLEAVREFAYGAGHELNNPLANIATRAQSLLLDETDPERRRRLAAIADQAFRGRDMIGGLMVFARPPKPTPARHALDELLTAAVEAVQPAASGRGVRLLYSPPPVPLAVCVDAAHVTEAIRLVALNAIEAVAAGGSVSIEVQGDATDARGGCVVTIADDGPGMDAATLRRSFDPFFSGREAGRGIGLGLPKAWRLLEANGGTIEIDSRPAKGSRVVIRLPGAAVAPGLEAAPAR